MLDCMLRGPPVLRYQSKTGALCSAIVAGALTGGFFAMETRVSAALPSWSGAPPLDPRVSQNEGCVDCHADIASEWRGSLHRASFTDPIFQAALAAEPRPFCRSCHAPEANPDSGGESARHAVGVGCVTCHIVEGRIVTARADPQSRPPHDVVVDPSFRGDAACARCHEFPFPEGGSGLMQATVGEHRASARAQEPCAACHMKPSTPGGRASHAFDIRGPRGLLRSSIRASARRAGESAIVVSLSARNPGHAVPTGDLFRRLEVRASTDAGLEAKPETLARRFVVRPVGRDGSVTRVLVGDDRLPPSGAAREVTLLLGPGAQSSAVRWEVVYRRMDPALSLSLGVASEDREIVLSRGILPSKEARK